MEKKRDDEDHSVNSTRYALGSVPSSSIPMKLKLPTEEEWIPSRDVDGGEISNNHPFIYPSGPANIPDTTEKLSTVDPELLAAKSGGEEIQYGSSNGLESNSLPQTDKTQQQLPLEPLQQINPVEYHIKNNDIDIKDDTEEGTPKSNDGYLSSATPQPPPPHMPGAHPGVSVGYNMLYPLQNMEMKNLNLRRGKWTEEEEAYTNKIIEAFNEGTLVLPGMEGITLRAFLANKLPCDPMRITKKFTGASCLGKRVYHSSSIKHGADAEVMKTTREIERLERKFHAKLKETRNTRPPDGASDLNCSAVHGMPSASAIQQQLAHMVPPWAYGASQAAMMQQYLSYTRNFPLNAYVQATQSQQPMGVMGSNNSTSDTTSLDANNSSGGDNSNGNSNSDHSSDKSNEDNSSNGDEEAAARKNAESQHQLYQLHQLQQLQQQHQYQEQLQQQHSSFVNPLLGAQGYNNTYHDIIMRHLMMQQQQQQMNLSAEQMRQAMAMWQTQYSGDLHQSNSTGNFQQKSAEESYAEQQRIFENAMAQYHYAMATAAAAAAANNGIMEASLSNQSLNSASSNDANDEESERKSPKKQKNDQANAVTLDDESAASSLLGLHSSM